MYFDNKLHFIDIDINTVTFLKTSNNENRLRKRNSKSNKKNHGLINYFLFTLIVV